jgi:hypothetical protein
MPTAERAQGGASSPATGVLERPQATGGSPLQCELSLEGSIQARFEAFHRENPEIYRKLVRLARFMRTRGMRHASLDYLYHVLRWRVFLETKQDCGRKLNDHFTSRYARLIEDQEPDLHGFFSKRGLRS